MLENPDLDLAVAFGAAYYGLVKIGQGVRVGSGSPRAYYLGVARPRAVSRNPMSVRSCASSNEAWRRAAPFTSRTSFRGLGQSAGRLRYLQLELPQRRPQRRLVRVDDSFTALPPLQTVIKYGKKGTQRAIPVKVEAEYTEVGTLALWCRSRISEHRWKLQFQLRETAAPEAADDTQVLELAVVEAARDLMHRVLSGNDKSRAEKIVKKLSRIVDLPRDDWPFGFIRSLADDLLDLTPVRNKGPDFESAWMNLLGFCLRPGIGESLDKQRLQRLWKLYPNGPVHGKNPRVRLEWWIMWRRVAAGLTQGQQRQFFQDLSAYFSKKKPPPRKSPPRNGWRSG